MRIGIDFDNTLACYDRVFTRLARERGEIGPDECETKQGIRQRMRHKENGEFLWQCLQGEIYGLRMQEAEQFMGEDDFLRRCANTPGLQVFIVSHKTEFGHFDATRTSLREAARQWMRGRGFFDPAKYAIPETHVFFESTQEEKIARIASLRCDVFIDDLAELFSHPDFPPATRKILFSDAASCGPATQVERVCSSWPEIEEHVLGN